MSRIGILALLILAIVSACREDRQAAANKLVTESALLMERVGEESREEARLALLKQVHSNLMAVVERYPDSDVAVRLSTGQGVGRLRTEEIKTLIEPLERSVAEGECAKRPTKECLADIAFRRISKVGFQDANIEVYLDAISALAEVSRFDDASVIASRLSWGKAYGYAIIAKISRKPAHIDAARALYATDGHRNEALAVSALLAEATMNVEAAERVASALPQYFRYFEHRALAATINVLHANGRVDSLHRLLNELSKQQDFEYALVVFSSKNLGKQIEDEIVSRSTQCLHKGQCLLALAHIARSRQDLGLSLEVERLAFSSDARHGALSLAHIWHVLRKEQLAADAIRRAQEPNLQTIETLYDIGLILERQDLVSMAVRDALSIRAKDVRDAKYFEFLAAQTLALLASRR